VLAGFSQNSIFPQNRLTWPSFFLLFSLYEAIHTQFAFTQASFDEKLQKLISLRQSFDSQCARYIMRNSLIIAFGNLNKSWELPASSVHWFDWIAPIWSDLVQRTARKCPVNTDMFSFVLEDLFSSSGLLMRAKIIIIGY
jgi:hypothetical protein